MTAPDRAFGFLASPRALHAAPALVAAAIDEVCLAPAGRLSATELWLALDKRLAAQRVRRVLAGPIPRQPKVVSSNQALQAYLLHALHADDRVVLRTGAEGGAVITARRSTRAAAFGVVPSVAAADAAVFHVLQHAAAA